MNRTGQYFEVELKQAHLGWGTHRHTDTRGKIDKEAYIPIPAKDAYYFKLTNRNATNGEDIVGANLFYCESRDGLFREMLLAQGCQGQGQNALFAKQFSVPNDLKALGYWYEAIGAEVGDYLRLTWISNTELQIELL